MHEQAMQWIRAHADDVRELHRPRFLHDDQLADRVTVLDLGGRDINGSARDAFPNAGVYTVLDILPGDGVDIVANAATWEPGEQWDVVVAAEVFEHTAEWPAICRTAFKACRPGGRFIVTTAGPGRPPHSGVDGEFRLLPGEHYANVPAHELERVLIETGWSDVHVDSQPSPADTRAVATR